MGFIIVRCLPSQVRLLRGTVHKCEGKEILIKSNESTLFKGYFSSWKI